MELLEQLERLGDARKTWGWPEGDPDYVQSLSLSECDIPQLLATTRQWIEERDWPNDEDDVSPFAPIHAWRALAQLEAIEALPLLMEMLPIMDDRGDDWHLEEFPDVFGLIGPDTLSTLSAFLADEAQGKYARICVAHGLCKVGQRHVDALDRVVEILEGQLRLFTKNSEHLNAFLVSYLVDLRAVQSAEVIERAYAACAVDIIVVGN